MTGALEHMAASPLPPPPPPPPSERPATPPPRPLDTTAAGIADPAARRATPSTHSAHSVPSAGSASVTSGPPASVTGTATTAATSATTPSTTAAPMTPTPPTPVPKDTHDLAVDMDAAVRAAAHAIRPDDDARSAADADADAASDAATSAAPRSATGPKPRAFSVGIPRRARPRIATTTANHAPGSDDAADTADADADADHDADHTDHTDHTDPDPHSSPVRSVSASAAERPVGSAAATSLSALGAVGGIASPGGRLLPSLSAVSASMPLSAAAHSRFGPGDRGELEISVERLATLKERLHALGEKHKPKRANIDARSPPNPLIHHQAEWLSSKETPTIAEVQAEIKRYEAAVKRSELASAKRLMTPPTASAPSPVAALNTPATASATAAAASPLASAGPATASSGHGSAQALSSLSPSTTSAAAATAAVAAPPPDARPADLELQSLPAGLTVSVHAHPPNSAPAGAASPPTRPPPDLTSPASLIPLSEIMDRYRSYANSPQRDGAGVDTRTQTPSRGMTRTGSASSAAALPAQDPSCPCTQILDPTATSALCRLCHGAIPRVQMLIELNQRFRRDNDEFQHKLAVSYMRHDESALEMSRLRERSDELQTHLALRTQELSSVQKSLSAMGEKLVDEIEKRAELQHSKEAIQEELEDLTRSLFEEANVLVAEEARRRHGHEQREQTLEVQLDAMRGQLQMEREQLTELKERLAEMQRREMEMDELAARDAALGNDDSLASEQPSASSDHGWTPMPASSSASAGVADGPVYDSLLLAEFRDFLQQSPSLKTTKLHTVPFMKNVLEDDVTPCLKFGNNPRTSTRKLVDAIAMNTCFVEEVADPELGDGPLSAAGDPAVLDQPYMGLSGDDHEAAAGGRHAAHELASPVYGGGASGLSAASPISPNKSGVAPDSPTPPANTTPRLATGQPSTQAIFNKTVFERLSVFGSAISNGTLSMPVTTLPALDPNLCSACGRAERCRYHFKTTDAADDPWCPICLLCRDRLVAVCEFYNLIRHIRQGLYAQRRVDDVFADVVRLKRNMHDARCGRLGLTAHPGRPVYGAAAAAAAATSHRGLHARNSVQGLRHAAAAAATGAGGAGQIHSAPGSRPRTATLTKARSMPLTTIDGPPAPLRGHGAAAAAAAAAGISISTDGPPVAGTTGSRPDTPLPLGITPPVGRIPMPSDPQPGELGYDALLPSAAQATLPGGLPVHMRPSILIQTSLSRLEDQSASSPAPSTVQEPSAPLPS